VVANCCSLAANVLSDTLVANEGSPDAVAVTTEGNKNAQGLWRDPWIFDRSDWNNGKGSQIFGSELLGTH
jgi:hypothetical protein